MSEKVNVLGLGSVVKAKDGEAEEKLLYVVVARALMPEGESYSARYRLAIHPYGDAAGQEIITIHEKQITQVVFEGYSDETDDKFISDIIAKINNAPQKTAVTPTPQETVESKVETPNSEVEPEVDSEPQSESLDDLFARIK